MDGASLVSKTTSSLLKFKLYGFDPEFLAKSKEIECNTFTEVPLRTIIVDTKQLELIDELENKINANNMERSHKNK